MYNSNDIAGSKTIVVVLGSRRSGWSSFELVVV